MISDGRAMGARRDAELVGLVDYLKALSREQLQALVFGTGAYAEWKAQERLRVLTRRGELHRGRCSVTDSYVYWRGRWPGNLDHLVLANWIYVLARPEEWHAEYSLGAIVADAFFIEDGAPHFLECHRSVNRSSFAAKVEGYVDYYESLAWDTEDWPTPRRFAKLVVLTDAPEVVRRAIGAKDRVGLRWAIVTPDDIKQRRWC